MVKIETRKKKSLCHTAFHKQGYLKNNQRNLALHYFLVSHIQPISGPMLAAWLTPPIVPILKVYLFNITNPSQVLKKIYKK